MATEHSHNIIKQLNDQHEANEYIGGLLQDPAMRADMERAEQSSMWQEAAEGLDDIPQREASQERGMER